MKSATTGVLLITPLSALVTPINFACAIRSEPGRPRTHRDIQAIAPVSRNPATTTYNAAMVATPGFAKPAKA